jgi:hypothetical protein
MRSVLFTTSMLPRVADFECGNEPWEKEVADWIRMPPESGDGALFWSNRGTTIWLYETSAGEVIGFASLGVSHWEMRHSVTNVRSDRPIQIIPALAIQTRFQGFPKDVPKELRYSSRILSDVIAIATERCNLEKYPPLLALYVHERNERAIKLYQRPEYGFVKLGNKPNRDGYWKMYVDVSDANTRWQ